MARKRGAVAAAWPATRTAATRTAATRYGRDDTIRLHVNGEVVELTPEQAVALARALQG